MKLYETCFAFLLSPCACNFMFIHREDFFISFQFLILFKLITPIVCIVFRLWGCILHLSIHQQLQIFFRFHILYAWKKQPFKAKFDSLFFYFSNIFWILSFSIFISTGFISASSSKFCWPRMLIKSIVVCFFLLTFFYLDW